MFQQLHQLAQSCASLTLLITSASATEMTITVIPKSKKDNEEAALATPLQLTATPEEFAEGFVNALTSYTDSRGSLADQVEATKTILEAAKNESAKKATKQIAKPATNQVEVKAGTNGDDDNDEDEVGGANPEDDEAQTSTDSESNSAATVTPLNLWG